MHALTGKSLVVPGIVVRIVKDRCIRRSRLAVSGIRIDLIHFASVRSIHVVFVAVPLLRADDIPFPDAGIPDPVHVVRLRIPVIKITDDTHRGGIRRPDPEKKAFLTIVAHEWTGPKIVITLIIFARIEKIRLVHVISPTYMGMTAHFFHFIYYKSTLRKFLA